MTDVPLCIAGELLAETVVEDTLPMKVDCVAWNQKFNILAVGAYELSENDTSVQIGQVYIVKLDTTYAPGFSVLQKVESSGVLDLKWEPEKEEQLAVATSSSILFLKSHLENETPVLSVMGEYILAENVMGLYIEWMDEFKVIFSDSEGCVSLINVSSTPRIIQTKKLHENLTWVVHFNHPHNMVYAGADDGTFTAFNLENMRMNFKHFFKRFALGVTSISSKGDLVAIGSYDDNLRIYTISGTDSKVILTLNLELNLGGAVWRTKWLPRLDESEVEDEFIIGAACAKNGIHFVKIRQSDWAAKTVFNCLTHVGSLAYGLDVKVNEDDYTVATCYFDNKVLHVWKMKGIHL